MPAGGTVRVRGYSDAGAVIARDLAKVVQAIREVELKSNTANKGMGSLGKTLLSMAGGFGLATTLSGLTSAMANFAAQAMEMGMAAEMSRAALDAVAGGATRAAVAMMEVDAATVGTVSSMESAKLAATMLSTGMVQGIDQIERFAHAAATLGRAFRGLAPTESLEMFNRMIANRSIKLLDDFGIGIAAVNARMREMGETGQEAFQLAVMDIAIEKAAELEGVWETSATSMQKLKAAWVDFKTSLGTGIADAVVPAVEGFQDIRKANKALATELAMTSATAEEFAVRMINAGLMMASEVETDFNSIIEQYQRLRAAMYDNIEAARLMQFTQSQIAVETRAAAEALAEQAAQQETAQAALDSLIEYTRAYAQALNEQAARQMAAMNSMDAFMEAGKRLWDTEARLASIFQMISGQLNTMNLSAARQRDMLFELGLATGQFTEQEIAAAQAVSALANAWEAGGITAQQYADALLEIQSGADAAQVATEVLEDAAMRLAMLEFTGEIDVDVSAVEEVPQTLDELQARLEEFSAAFAALPEELAIDFATNAGETFAEVGDLLDGVTQLQGLAAAVYNIQASTNAPEIAGMAAALREAVLSVPTYIRIVYEHVEKGAPPVPGGGGGAGGSGGAKQLGGPITRTSEYLVGEAGPEMVKLPAGAMVYPAGMQGLAGGGATTNITHNQVSITVDVKEAMDIIDIIKRIEREGKLHGFEVHIIS